MLTIPGDVWTLILRRLPPKDAILFVMTVNQSLQSYLREKVKWQQLIMRDFSDYLRVEKYCQQYYSGCMAIYPQYRKVFKQRNPFAKYWMLLRDKNEDEFGMPSYGTCDSPQQLAETFPTYSGKVYLSAVYRASQPRIWGWRWHKWGGYYGKLRPKSKFGDAFEPEYLADANGKNGNPCIDVTYVFNRHKTEYGGYDKYVFHNGTAWKIEQY